MMMTPRFTDSRRRLDIPIYRLSEGPKPDKSCFINHNRPDTVRPDYMDWVDKKQETL